MPPLNRRRAIQLGLGTGAAALLSAGLAGCWAGQSEPVNDPRITSDPPPGNGQSFDSAAEAVKSIPGLELTRFSTAPPNIKRNTGYSVHLTITAGYEVADGPALVEYLLRTVWSVRDRHMPNSTIDFSFVDLSSPKPFDVFKALKAGKWVPAEKNGIEVTEDGYSHSVAWVDPDMDNRMSPSNLRRLGPWPGPVPTQPSGMLRKIRS